MSPPYPRRATHRIAAGSAAAFLLLTWAVLGHFGPLFRLDAVISEAARHAALAHPGWRATMAAVTITGSTVVLFPVAAVACLLLLWARRWRRAVFVAVAMPLTIVIRLPIVVTIARPRPVDRLGPSAGWSFPSGHSTASATAALIAILVCWPLLRNRWSRILLVAGASGWAVAVGVSRVALVVHWPSDVIGAWLLVLTVVPSIGWGMWVLLAAGGRPATLSRSPAPRRAG